VSAEGGAAGGAGGTGGDAGVSAGGTGGTDVVFAGLVARFSDELAGELTAGFGAVVAPVFGPRAAAGFAGAPEFSPKDALAAGFTEEPDAELSAEAAAPPPLPCEFALPLPAGALSGPLQTNWTSVPFGSVCKIRAGNQPSDGASHTSMRRRSPA